MPRMTENTHQNQQHVFRAYDIRGVVDEDFDESWVIRLGKACASFFLQRGQQTVVVGYDCRMSSPGYSRALIEGIVSVGAHVVCIGMVPTPFVYFAVKHLGLAAGVMVTASHNPHEYNGFKIWSGETTLAGAEIQTIRALMDDGLVAAGRGLVSELDIFPAYRDAVCRRIRFARPVSVVLDGGNGAGGEFCRELLTCLGAKVIPLYCEPDGRFPNHHPDPVVEANLADLKAAVSAGGADIGIGLDGDADRIGVVDENGRFYFGDEILALYARDVLTRMPGARIIGDVKCSHRLFKDIADHGGTAEMYATGHSLIKARMLETGAALAGEMSGHMFFREGWYGFDDGLFAAARLVALLAASAVPFSRMLCWPPGAVTPEIQMDCPDADKMSVVDRAKAYFRDRYDMVAIDGVRLVFPDGWGLVRASNTQPALVLRFEAVNEQRLAEIRSILETPLRSWVDEAVRKRCL